MRFRALALVAVALALAAPALSTDEIPLGEDPLSHSRRLTLACVTAADCGVHTLCIKGKCLCSEGFSSCDGKWETGCEVNRMTDPKNCGKCGRVCPPHTYCKDGRCPCSEGWLNCDGNPTTGCEANKNTDPNNCGRCGIKCTSAQYCDDGVCVDRLHETEGECTVDMDTNPTNCGLCGSFCGSNQACVAAKCECKAGFKDCNAKVEDGCEVNTLIDPLNCGDCGKAVGANQVCQAGAAVCLAGYEDCNKDAKDGCEVNKLTDPANCGACGNKCAPTQQCMNGACVCAKDYKHCTSNAVDVCETNVLSSAAHCGDCGKPVSANQVCLAGVATCSAGYDDCNRDAKDGCEAKLLVDPLNCGACGVRCDVDENCLGGKCQSKCLGCSLGCEKGQRLCQTAVNGVDVAACINNNTATCCDSSECKRNNDYCEFPGGTCKCLKGFKPCVTKWNNNGTIVDIDDCIPENKCCANGADQPAHSTCPKPNTDWLCDDGYIKCTPTLPNGTVVISCIKNDTCCTNAQCDTTKNLVCSTPGGWCKCDMNNGWVNCKNGTFSGCIKSDTCCLDSDCPLANQVCQGGAGGTCACAKGFKLCETSYAKNETIPGTNQTRIVSVPFKQCIPDTQCCTNSDCAARSNQHCYDGLGNVNPHGGPTGTCQCDPEYVLCGTTTPAGVTFDNCIKHTAPGAKCCTNSDCASNPFKNTCSAPGDVCI